MSLAESKRDFFPLSSCDDNDRKTIPSDGPLFLRKRYYVIGLIFVGFLINIMLRVNLSISIVDMTSKKTFRMNNETYVQPAEYDWTPPQKGIILSSFSWGLIFAPIGVVFVDRFGGTAVYGYTILLTGCLTLLSPVFLLAGMYTYIGARVVEGFTELSRVDVGLLGHASRIYSNRRLFRVAASKGVTSTAMYSTFVHWVPYSERSRLISFVYFAMPVASMVSYSATGLVSYSFGWRLVFYTTGGCAVIWFVIWLLTVSATPQSDTLITNAEKMYFEKMNEIAGIPSKKVVHPWKTIMTSKAVLAYLNERFVESWSLSFMTYCLPLYIKDVHSVNIKEIGFLSAIPHFCAVCSLISGSWLQDYVRTRKIMTRTKLHKSFILFGQLVAVIILLVAGLSTNFRTTFIAFCIFKTGFSIAQVSYHVLPVEISLQHANLLMSLSMTSLSLGYLLNPIIMGFMVQHHTNSEWSRYFLFLSVFNVWGAIIFAIYGSGEIQPWVGVEVNSGKENKSNTEL